ncbi:exopolyphosphatase [Novosphingobium bradum]|uniref:Exopolyphosphatase n=1 Tax=Novosphingobium bradum TaxID=1737444 RepID=A0ABV7IQ45_9SPHN
MERHDGQPADEPAKDAADFRANERARAIIDVGSNTVRLVVYGGPARAPTVLHNEKVTARLGRGVAETGRLSRKAVAAALAALARYRCLLDLQGVREVDLVATAAVRDAADGPKFLEDVARLGFVPRLLAGEEEALASAMGVLGAFPGAHGVVADLGGGSLELVDIVGAECRHGVSLPLGTLRLAALRAGTPKAFLDRVGALLAEAEWAAPHGPTLFLVGGSFRSFARHAMQMVDWPSDDPHGFELTADKARALARDLAATPAEAMVPIPGVSAARLAALPDAAALLGALIRTMAPARLVFSSWGLREGLLFGSLDPATRAQDPLSAAVAAFADQEGCSPAVARIVAKWTAPAASPGDERLRLAATALALASTYAEPNLRADLAVGWAMRKRWIGIDSRGRAMLAAALMANTGRLDVPKAWRAFAPVADLATAQAWGLAVRLCRRFSGGAETALAGSRIALDAETLRLSVSQPYAALVNEGVQRDLKALATLLGRKPAWDIAD